MGLVKEYIKSHTPTALRLSIRQLGTELWIYYRHRLSLMQARRVARSAPLKLHLGCGTLIRPGWVNIDLNSAADLQLDLREPFPFPDRSVAYIYSEHVFEHLEIREEVPNLLSEALRVLQPMGVFDVGVPDTEWALSAYGNPDHEYWPHTPKWHPPSCETQLDHINYHFRQGTEHKYAWDEVTLRRALEKAGFVNIARRAFDESLDSEHRRIGTLYMRATKPGAVIPNPD